MVVAVAKMMMMMMMMMMNSVVYTISSTNSVMLYSVNTRNARLTGILLNFLGLISYD